MIKLRQAGSENEDERSLKNMRTIPVGNTDSRFCQANAADAAQQRTTSFASSFDAISVCLLGDTGFAVSLFSVAVLFLGLSLVAVRGIVLVTVSAICVVRILGLSLPLHAKQRAWMSLRSF